MNCIIFDLEWNEIVPYQLAMQNEIGFPLSGEIIEIGAVRMTGDGDLSVAFVGDIRSTGTGGKPAPASFAADLAPTLVRCAKNFRPLLFGHLRAVRLGARGRVHGRSDGGRRASRGQ